MKLSTDWIVGLGALPEKTIVEVRYASVYDERWRATSYKIVPERLD